MKKLVFRDPASKQEEAWCVELNGEVLAARWLSKGAAQAGALVEERRLAKRSGISALGHATFIDRACNAYAEQKASLEQLLAAVEGEGDMDEAIYRARAAVIL